MASKAYDIAFQLNAKMNKSYGSVFSSATNIANKTLGAIKNVAGKMMSSVLSLSAVTDAIDVYKGFEQSMANAAAIAGVEKGTDAYNALERAALDAGKATSKTAEESADALSYMALAGWGAEDSIKGLMPILRLSEATQADLATTSDLVTDSMSALGLKVEDLGRFLDVSAAANNKSNQTAIHLLEAYIGAGGVFKSFNTDITESATLLGVMANRGIKGSEAGTKMSSVLINMTKKTGQSADALKTLGINAYDSEGKFKGITNVLMELNEKTKDLTEEKRNTLLQMIGGKTQLDTLNALLSSLNTVTADGSTELHALMGELENSEGALDTMATAINNTMTGAMYRLSSAVDDLKINLVDKLAPYITPIIDKIAAWLPTLTENISGKLDGFAGVARNVAGAIQDAIPFVIDQITRLANIIKKLWSWAQPLFKWLKANPELIGDALTAIGAAIIAHKVVTGIMGVAGAFKALGIALTANPIGIAVMALATAIGFVAVKVAEANQELKQADLADHFGDISLSMAEIEEVARQILNSSSLEGLGEALNAMLDVEELQDSVEEAMRTINKLNWKVSIGLELTEEEIGSYRENIKTFINNTNEMLIGSQYAINLSLGFLTDDNETGTQIKNWVNDFYSKHSGELTRLGNELQSAVDTAFTDGLLSIDEQKTIAELQQKMANITEALTRSRFEAKMEILNMNFDGTSLTGESFKALQEQMALEIEASSAKYQEALELNIANAKVMLDQGAINRSDYETMISTFKENYLENIGALELTASGFQMDTIMGAYEREIDRAFPKFADKLSEKAEELKYLMATEDDYLKSDHLQKLLPSDLKEATGLSDATLQNFKDLYNNLKPVLDGLKEIKRSYREAGDAVPEILEKDIAKITALGAMAGDAEAATEAIWSSMEASSALLRDGTLFDALSIEEIPAQKYTEAGTYVANTIMDSIKETLENGIDVTVPINANIATSNSHMFLPSTRYNIQGYATGSNFTPNAFIAGERGPELILNAAGSRVFTAAETEDIFNNRFGNIFNPRGKLPSLSGASVSETAIELNYSPQIRLEGGSAADEARITTLLRGNAEYALELFKEWLSENQEREMRLANA
jgi:TP901 family phage tail tape measure protein